MRTVEFHILFFSIVVVATYGVTVSPVLSQARIWLRLRVSEFWGSALYCPVCAGFWVSCVVAIGWTATAFATGRTDVAEILYIWGMVLKSTALLIVLAGAMWWPETPYEVETEGLRFLQKHLRDLERGNVYRESDALGEEQG